jgi:hypothetical protein
MGRNQLRNEWVVALQYKEDPTIPWTVRAYIHPSGLCAARVTMHNGIDLTLIRAVSKFLDIGVIRTPGIGSWSTNNVYSFNISGYHNLRRPVDEDRLVQLRKIIEFSAQYAWTHWHKDIRVPITNQTRNSNRYYADLQRLEVNGSLCIGCGKELGHDYLHIPDGSMSPRNGSTLCVECRDAFESHCEWCSGAISIGDSTECRNRHLYHSDCYDEMHADDEDVYDEDYDNGVIRGWDWRPSSFMQHHASDDTAAERILSTGIELEVEFRDGGRIEASNEIASMVSDAQFYMKQDGSLESGFEIVSHPHTLKALRESKLEEIMNVCRRHGGESDGEIESCGLHVHIPRAALEFQDLIKMGLLVNNLPDVWLPLSRRSRPNYSEYREKTALDAAESLGRYEAINHTNRQTVELRIWNGSLDYQKVMGSIELTHGLVNWIKTQTPERFEDQLPKLFIEFAHYMQKSGKYDAASAHIQKMQNEIDRILRDRYGVESGMSICA